MTGVKILPCVRNNIENNGRVALCLFCNNNSCRIGRVSSDLYTRVYYKHTVDGMYHVSTKYCVVYYKKRAIKELIIGYFGIYIIMFVYPFFRCLKSFLRKTKVESDVFAHAEHFFLCPLQFYGVILLPLYAKKCTCFLSNSDTACWSRTSSIEICPIYVPQVKSEKVVWSHYYPTTPVFPGHDKHSRGNSRPGNVFFGN